MRDPDTFKRYLKLFVLFTGAGAIYPIIYLRQNFEITLLESLGITMAELGECYAIIGVVFVATYLPGGWLADRVRIRILMSFSLAFSGLLALWFSTLPSLGMVKLIFAGWGISTGLTFWSAMIKAVAILAKPNEQGRFFGILDGGRGLIEALIATIVITAFAYWLNVEQLSAAVSLQRVILIYAGIMLVLSPIMYLAIDNSDRVERQEGSSAPSGKLWSDVKIIARKPEIWLCTTCILIGYQLFWATYSFSAYLQTYLGLGAVGAGTITVAKLWMRPIGAAAAGFAGDLLDRERVLAGLCIASSLALVGLTFLPVEAAFISIAVVVLSVGLLTYGIRGIFWATLESAGVESRVKGLAIGMISLVGFSPDIYLPLINGALVEAFPGRAGLDIYFYGIAASGLIGAWAALKLRRMANAP
jgi:sugar phosphate permease